MTSFDDYDFWTLRDGKTYTIRHESGVFYTGKWDRNRQGFVVPWTTNTTSTIFVPIEATLGVELSKWDMFRHRHLRPAHADLPKNIRALLVKRKAYQS